MKGVRIKNLLTYLLLVVSAAVPAAANGDMNETGEDKDLEHQAVPAAGTQPVQYLLTVHGSKLAAAQTGGGSQSQSRGQIRGSRQHSFGSIGPETVAPVRKSDVVSGLTPGARQLAIQLGILQGLNELLEQNQIVRSLTDAERIKRLELRQGLVEQVFTAHMEVHSVVSRIDADTARADNLHALFQEREDHALRLNSIANFIAGGITDMVGNPIKIGGFDVPGDILDTATGGVQAGLASLAYQQQSKNKKQAHGVPNMLARLFDRPTDPSMDYPDSVWNFLVSAPPGANPSDTRRRLLVRTWLDARVLERHKRAKGTLEERISRISGTGDVAGRVYIDDLAARSAMLSGLRAVVTEMDQYLMEIMWLITGHPFH